MEFPWLYAPQKKSFGHDFRYDHGPRIAIHMATVTQWGSTIKETIDNEYSNINIYG